MQKFCLTWKDFNSVFNKEFNEVNISLAELPAENLDLPPFLI